MFLVAALASALLGLCSIFLWSDDEPSTRPLKKVDGDYPMSWPLNHPLSEFGKGTDAPKAILVEAKNKRYWSFSSSPQEGQAHRISHLQFKYSGEKPLEVALQLNGERFPLDLNHVVAQIKAGHTAPQERALAAFRWVSERTVNFIPPTGKGFPDHDPQTFTNSFRYGFCDDAAEHLAQLHAAVGISSKVIGLNGHVVVQSEIEGRLVYFDPDYKMTYWDNDHAQLLSRENVCKSKEHHFYKDSIVNVIYAKSKVNRLVDIVCEERGRRGVVAASYRKGKQVGDPLWLEIARGTRIDFFPSRRLGRMAMAKPRVEDNVRVGYLRIDSPLRTGSKFPVEVEERFALPVLSASLLVEVETEHAFQVETKMSRPGGMSGASVITEVPSGRSLVEVSILEVSDLAPYNKINQLRFTLGILGHPQPAGVKLTVRLLTSHQVASDAFPKLSPGQNTVSLITPDSRLVEDVKWEVAIQTYEDITATAPRPILVERPLEGGVRLEWEASSKRDLLYDLEVVAKTGHGHSIFPVLAAGLVNPFLEIRGSALDKLREGQGYRWRVRKRSKLGDMGPYSAWQSFMVPRRTP